MADNGQLRRKGLTIEDSTQASHGSNRLFALISKGRLNQNGLYKTIKIFLLPSASCSGCPAYLHSKGLFFFSFDRGVENKYKSRVDDRQEELYTTSTYPRGRRQGKERKNKKKVKERERLSPINPFLRIDADMTIAFGRAKVGILRRPYTRGLSKGPPIGGPMSYVRM